MQEKEPRCERMKRTINELLEILFGNPQNISLEPATEEDLALASRTLGVALPFSYRQLLKRSDGLTAYQTEVFFGTRGEENLVGMKNQMREEIPAHLLPFFHGLGGVFYHFDTSTSEEGEYPVVEWDQDQLKTTLVYPTFRELLEGILLEFETGF